MSSACSEIIDDIEDLISSQEITPKERYSSRKSVNVRAKRKQKEHRSSVEPIISVPESYLPGCGWVWVKTWGCSHNSSDAEYMSGLLAAQGYNLADNPFQADLWLLNSCTVKSPAEDHFRNQIEKGLKLGKRVVVAGCVPQAAPRAKYLRGLSLVGVQQIDRIVEVVEETFKGNTVRLFGAKRSPGGGKAGGASLTLPKVRRNPLIEIISISTGCLNQCTYCKTKHARGELGSYPPEEIVARLRQCALEGCVEIWLTSEDTGAYGKDIGTSLPDLLELLTSELDNLPGDMRLRLGMTNPPYILEHLPRIAQILNHPKVYKFLHVPVQSGSDEVLAEMKREYNVSEFRHLVDYLQEHVPGITIATDIICGFPTESEADWAGTVSLCAHYRFKSLFINQFYPRPGTPAARLPQLPAASLKLRTRTLTELFHSYQPYDDRVGEMYEVLVTETSSDGRYYVGHNKYYEQVLVPLDPRYLGAHLTVRITDVSKWSMKGEVVGSPRAARISIETKIPTDKLLSNGPGAPTDAICASNLNAPSYAICAILIAIALRIVWFLI